MPSHLSGKLFPWHRFRCWYPSDHVWRKYKRHYKVCSLPIQRHALIFGTKMFGSDTRNFMPPVKLRLSKEEVTLPMSYQMPKYPRGCWDHWDIIWPWSTEDTFGNGKQILQVNPQISHATVSLCSSSQQAHAERLLCAGSCVRHQEHTSTTYTPQWLQADILQGRSDK